MLESSTVEEDDSVNGLTSGWWFSVGTKIGQQIGGLGFYSQLHIDNLEAVEAILCNLLDATPSFSHWAKLLNDPSCNRNCPGRGGGR